MDRATPTRRFSKRSRYRGPYGPRSPVVWALIVLGIATVIALAASDGNPLTAALIYVWFGFLGVIGWMSNYEELREDSVYVSRAAGIHGGADVFGSSIPYDSIVAITTRRSKDVVLQCMEGEKLETRKIMVASYQRDEFVAELVDRIEATCGRKIDVGVQ